MKTFLRIILLSMFGTMSMFISMAIISELIDVITIWWAERL